MILAFCTVGCSAEVSSYHGVGLVTSNRSDSASFTFHSFEGKKVFTLKSTAACSLEYSAESGEGSFRVTLKNDDGKTELLSLKDGEEIASVYRISGAQKLTVILETEGECSNGALTLKIRYD